MKFGFAVFPPNRGSVFLNSNGFDETGNERYNPPAKKLYDLSD
jgi:hypothetical protein